jgi:uncharacterized UBP type Zn finger protein
VSHARDGGFGDSFRRRITDAPHGSFIVHPQCDAAEFLEAITDVLTQWEQERVGGVAAVAREACFGMVHRSRMACKHCSHVSDSLELVYMLPLTLPRSAKEVTLAAVLLGYFREW